jgi:hypothetical protein
MRFNTYPSDVAMKGDEIRLIKLRPGQWTEDIQCQLVYDSLSNVRPYKALSYVWGSRNKSRRIDLNGCPFYITINLEHALRHLRHQLTDTLLWIDALSINQTNDRERTHQVNLMGQIYKSSQGVLVYLGDSIPRCRRKAGPMLVQKAPPIVTFSENKKLQDIESYARDVPASVSFQEGGHAGSQEVHEIMLVFDLIRMLSQADHLKDIPVFREQEMNSSERASLNRLFESLRQLMHAPVTPWWGRIWVVQEIILPPEAIVVHGTVSAPWSMFATAASRCSYHLNHCCAKQVEKLPRDILNVLKDFCDRVLDIEKMRSICRPGSPDLAQLRRLQSVVTNDDSTERSSLITLLRRFRNRKATDPRDKVYALLSLVDPSTDRPPLIPDYSLSEAEVYINASIESIYASKSLSVLSIDVARKYRQDLPSWVPDWEAPGDFSHNERISTISLYDTCSEYRLDPSTVRLHDRELMLEGRCMDEVSSVGKVMLSDSVETFRNIMEDWIRTTNSAASVSSWDQKLLWRILCADVVYDSENGAREIPRRAHAPDELMFVTWAKLSRKSPFYDQQVRLERYLSPMAVQWSRKLEFESLVKADLEDPKNIQRVARYWETLYPDQTVRKAALVEAMIRSKTKNTRRSRELLANATASVEAIAKTRLDMQIELLMKNGITLEEARKVTAYKQENLEEAAERIQEQVWGDVPWRNVYDVHEPELLEAIGDHTGTTFLPYDTQISIIDRSIVSATKARRLYTTRNGYAGLGPTELAAYDRLYLIKGGNTPFMLRHYPSLRMVGDCYTFGLMDSADVKSACVERDNQIRDMVKYNGGIAYVRPWEQWGQILVS